MSEPITFTTQMSFEDYLDANRVVIRKAWKPTAILKALLRLAVIVAIFAVPFAFYVDDDPSQVLAEVALIVGAGGVLGLAACFALQSFRLRGAARKMFDQLGTVDLPTTFELTIERFQSNFAQGSSWHPWTQFQDYVESDRMILIRRTQGVFFGIPKAQLDRETQTKVIELLDQVGLMRV